MPETRSHEALHSGCDRAFPPWALRPRAQVSGSGTNFLVYKEAESGPCGTQLLLQQRLPFPDEFQSCCLCFLIFTCDFLASKHDVLYSPEKNLQ